MTPKEKAEELIKRFTPFSRLYPEIIDNECLLSNDSKQCALIAVEELIYETRTKYWYDVKREIELL